MGSENHYVHVTLKPSFPRFLARAGLDRGADASSSRPSTNDQVHEVNRDTVLVLVQLEP